MRAIISALLFTVVLLSASHAWASEYPPCPAGVQCAYVRQDVPADENANIYNTITDGISSSAPFVYVFPGIYDEQVTYPATRSVTIKSVDGPLLTVISGGATRRTPVIFPTITATVNTPNGRLVGFTITNGTYGIEVKDHGQAFISSCVIEENQLDGIFAAWTGSALVTSIAVSNSVLRLNQRDGISLNPYSNCSYGGDMFTAAIHNSIFEKNARYGLYHSRNCSIGNAQRFSFSHSAFYQNAAGNMNAPLTNGTLTKGPGILEDVNPRFVNSPSGFGSDVRLQANSPLLDKGWDGVNAAMRDPDGTRNDMGAFGGPEARTYFISPVDGPTVREVIAPSVVRQGEPLTVRATGAVR